MRIQFFINYQFWKKMWSLTRRKISNALGVNANWGVFRRVSNINSNSIKFHIFVCKNGWKRVRIEWKSRKLKQANSPWWYFGCLVTRFSKENSVGFECYFAMKDLTKIQFILISRPTGSLYIQSHRYSHDCWTEEDSIRW